MDNEQTPAKKFLTIRNWSKFQSTTDKHGKSLEGRRREYVLDFCDKESDSLYSDLTITQRYMIDACRRMRGRLGHNIPNDAMRIVRQLDIHLKERAKAVKAVTRLIEVGFLIPTDEERSKVVQQPPTGGQPAANGDQQATNAGETNGINDITSSSNPNSISNSKDTVKPIRFTGKPDEQSNSYGDTGTDQKPNRAAAGSDWKEELQKTEGPKYAAVMFWKENNSDFWKGKTLRSPKAYRSVEDQYDKYFAKLPAGKKPHEIPVAKAKPVVDDTPLMENEEPFAQEESIGEEIARMIDSGEDYTKGLEYVDLSKLETPKPQPAPPVVVQVPVKPVWKSSPRKAIKVTSAEELGHKFNGDDPKCTTCGLMRGRIETERDSCRPPVPKSEEDLRLDRMFGK